MLCSDWFFSRVQQTTQQRVPCSVLPSFNRRRYAITDNKNRNAPLNDTCDTL
jgi:hypothetical protein